MEPTLSFTPAPTIRLVMNEVVRSDGRQDERYEHVALDARLETVLDTLDELHDAASEGALTGVNRADLLGMLRDLIYTAEQTMAEIEGRGADYVGQSTLALVRKRS